jgi:hypothetical protein
MKRIINWIKELFISRPAALKQRIAELEDTLTKMSKDMDDLVNKRCELLDIAIRNGAVTVEAASEVIQYWAALFDKMRTERSAKNYIEMQLCPRGTERFITVTLQYSDGKTPHQCRAEAEAELDEARKQSATFRALLERYAPNRWTINTALRPDEVRDALEAQQKGSKL